MTNNLNLVGLKIKADHFGRLFVEVPNEDTNTLNVIYLKTVNDFKTGNFFFDQIIEFTGHSNFDLAHSLI